MTQISRTGVKLASTRPIEAGRSVSMTLSHGDDSIELRGAVRWCRPASSESLAGKHEIGIAFTEVGPCAADSLWRSLSAYGEGRY